MLLSNKANTSTYYDYIDIVSKNGELGIAKEVLDLALDHNLATPGMFMMFLEHLCKIGMEKEAQIEFQRFVKSFPLFPIVSFRNGEYIFNIHDVSEAIAYIALKHFLLLNESVDSFTLFLNDNDMESRFLLLQNFLAENGLKWTCAIDPMNEQALMLTRNKD